MLTTKDIRNITEAVTEAQKDLFYIKEEMDEKFSKLQSSVDGIVKNNVKTEQELTALGYRVEKSERWINRAASKIGIDLEH